MQKEAWRLCEAPPFGTVINTTLEYPSPAAQSSQQYRSLKVSKPTLQVQNVHK